MTDVLILGGTGWLSGQVARRWVDAGAAVTCLARGGRPAPAAAALVVADRGEPDAYSAIADREWDEIVDISSRAEHVAAAVAALADRAAHWTYVSTVSVYARDDVEGEDESAPLAEPAQPGDEYDYSREKAAAEASVLAALDDRAAIVRPGLVVGPGDPTDRFGYWVSRFALAGSEPVLVPASTAGVSVIDVDDLADLVFAVGRERWSGVANAVGHGFPLDEVLTLARDVAGHTGEVVSAPGEWLEEHDVSYWMGPRSLPLWLPDEAIGHWTRSNAVYRARGGRLRPLRETLERTLDDERARGLGRERASGLSRADEREILAELR
ncbi:SDR family oxidoreductase [Microbacterium aoyamense]|uniref:SDR family oxidoreductase n=1 Tax=Microbacterium aoyamense TaxID=344166 RepID=A0ABP5B6G3_9MICO|nr:NAD-dependent epimerase/dehydratase family protein [Microbacterium aoyamense]